MVSPKHIKKIIILLLFGTCPCLFLAGLGTYSIADALRSGGSVQCEGYVTGSPALGDVDGNETIDIICGDASGKIYAFDGKTKRLVWKSSTGTIIHSSPAIVDLDNSGLYDVVIANGNGVVYRLNGRTGQPVWRFEGKGKISSSPAIADMDRDGILDVVVSTEDAYLHIINGKTGEGMRTIKCSAPVYSTPCLIDLTGDRIPDIIVGEADYKVYAYNGESRSQLWSYQTNGRITGSASAADINKDGIPEIVIGSEDGRIYSLRGNSGERIWQYPTGDAIVQTPILIPAKDNLGFDVIITSSDKLVYLLNGNTGEKIWNMSAGGVAQGNPALGDVDNNRSLEILVGGADGKVYAYNAISGDIVSSISLGHEAILSPVVGDIDGDGVLDIVIASSQTRIFIVHTSTLTDKQKLVWPMISGNLRRTGTIDDKYGPEMNLKMAANQKRIDRLYQQAQAALKKKQWSEASTIFSNILSLNPSYAPAKSGMEQMASFSQMPKTILKIGIILLIGIGAGWLMFLHVFRTKTLKTIQEMLEQNQLDTVIAKYPKYIAKWKKYQFGPVLVKSMRAQERLDDLAISVYQDQLVNKDGTYNSQLLLILAKAYAEREKYDEEALPIFQEALKIKKNNPYFLRALGRVYRNLNQDNKTVEVFEHLYHQGERDPEVTTTLAKAYLGLSRTDESAMNIYAEAYQFASSDKELVQKLAELYLSQHQLDQTAVEIYQKAVKVDPKCVEYSLAISQYYLQTKNYQMAITFANNVLEYSPANSAALRGLGQAYLGLQDYQQAVTYLEKVYESYQEDKNYIADLAIAYAYRTDISPRAITIYQQAAQDNPKVATYHIALAKAYVEQGELNKALEELQSWEKLSPTDTELISTLYEKLLNSYPSNAAMHRQVIPLYLRTKKIPEALHSLSILTEVDPNQHDFALQAYSAILDYDPKNQIARLERGKLYGTKKKINEALVDFEILHEQHPKDKMVLEQLDKLYDSKLLQDEENLEVRFKYGLMLYAQSDIDRAIGQFQKTLRGGYREQESTKYLGLCFQKKGMYDLAYRQLSKLQIADDVKESLYEIANQYVKLRQYAKAIVVFEQIYSVDINYKDIKDQLEKLRQLPITSAPSGTAAAMSGVPGDIDATLIESAAALEPKSRYEIMQEIGRGNMGIICLARDKELDELVALKFLPDELIYDITVIERFKQEVRSARKLAHPSIVHIYDLNEELGRRFISMEYIQGKNLKDILFEKKKIPAADVVRICLQVASALEYAHSMKIVHRDIKPANIMLNDAGQVKVTDFGIAAMLERAGLTQTGSMVGTPLYMSPEQTEGTAIDGRSDLYSLGVMMYELVTGSPPFSSGNISYQQVHVKPQPPKKVPESLTAIIMKCLEKDPSQRYQNAKELIADLDKCANELKKDGTQV